MFSWVGSDFAWLMYDIQTSLANKGGSVRVTEHQEEEYLLSSIWEK